MTPAYGSKNYDNKFPLSLTLIFLLVIYWNFASYTPQVAI